MKISYLLFVLLFFLNMILLININYISKFLNIIDKPDKFLKKHKKDTFLMGGPIIFFNLSIVFLYFILNLNFTNDYLIEDFTKRNLLIFFLTSLCFFFTGFIDDKYKINPNLKFAIFIAILLFFLILDNNLLLQNISIFKTYYYIESIFISYVFTIFCFLAFINAFNFFDGINLQIGFYSIFLIFIFFIKGFFIAFWLVLLISIIFYLYLNFKNHSFLGDSGSLLLSFIFSYFFVLSHNNYDLFKADEIFLIMILPGIDMLRLTINRFLNKKNPLYGDRMHIHHLVEQKYGSVIAPFVTIFLSCLPYALYSLFQNSILIILLSIASYVFYISYLTKKNFT